MFCFDFNESSNKCNNIVQVQYLPLNCTRAEVSTLNKRKKKLKYNYLKTVRQDLQQPEVYIDSSKDLCV